MHSFFPWMLTICIRTSLPRPVFHVLKKALDMYPDPSRPDEELLELLRMNLARSDFVFNEKFDLQIKGTAMGKRFAPAHVLRP